MSFGSFANYIGLSLIYKHLNFLGDLIFIGKGAQIFPTTMNFKLIVTTWFNHF